MEPGEWSPLRVVVPTGGTHILAVGLPPYSEYSPLDHALQMDELDVTPLAPVTLGEALDVSDLPWSAAPHSWSGGASAIASPDASDAAWVVARADTPRWLETTLTGPGALRFWSWGSGELNVSVGGQPQRPLTAQTYEWEGGARWRAQVIAVPTGTHTVRIEPANWQLNGETALFGLDQMQWEPGSLTTLNAALDLPANAPLTTGGAEASGWQGSAVAAFSHDGSDAVTLRAPLTEPVWLEVSVHGPAMVSCWKNTGARAKFSFTLDGASVRPPGDGAFIPEVNCDGSHVVDPPAPTSQAER